MAYRYTNRGWHELLKIPRMSKRALANKMNIKEQTLYRYIDNKTVPLLNKILYACNKFDLDLSYFIESDKSAITGFDPNSTKVFLGKKELELSITREYEQKIRDISLSYMKEMTTTAELTLKAHIKELESMNDEIMVQNKMLNERNLELQNKLTQCGYGSLNMAAEGDK